ncbi:RNA-directed DNA polymerase, eukaryota, reverse transcriptase zinc-binding domain protein [Tanacetum coccineum]
MQKKMRGFSGIEQTQFESMAEIMKTIFSPLSEFIDTRDIYDARFSYTSTVKEIVHEERWKWPEEWNSDFVELGPLQVPILRDGIEDTAVWMSRNGHEKKFKISNVWMDMNSNGTKVDWHLLVWFAQSIPRHAFVTWLAIHGRLMTQDKLMMRKANEDLKCALCNQCSDSHNHLFFTCEFSKEVWNELLKLLNVRLSESWDQILIEMKVLHPNKNV